MACDDFVVSTRQRNRISTPISEIDRLQQTNFSIIEEVSFRVVSKYEVLSRLNIDGVTTLTTDDSINTCHDVDHIIAAKLKIGTSKLQKSSRGGKDDRPVVSKYNRARSLVISINIDQVTLGPANNDVSTFTDLDVVNATHRTIQGLQNDLSSQLSI